MKRSDLFKKGALGALVGGTFAATSARVSAQEEIAAAGNGGTADASANGGAVAVGDVNSGGNTGNTIGIGDTGSLVCDKWGKCWPGEGGSVAVDGGAVANSTTLDIDADGGTAIADASGGDYNVAFLDEFGFLS